MRVRSVAAPFGVLVLSLAVFAAPASAQVQSEASQGERLATIRAEITSDPQMRIPNTAISTDEADGVVSIEYYEGMPDDMKGQLRDAQAKYGSDVRLVPLSGELVQTEGVSGGYGVVNANGGRCTLGFNMIKNGEYYFVTAGHCTSNSQYWYLGRKTSSGTWLAPKDADYLGSVAGTWGPPFSDIGVVKYSSMASGFTKLGDVYHYTSTHQNISTIGSAASGMWVCASGTSSGERCGAITDVCTDVTYNDGTHYSCMIRVPICTLKGDSGGPLWRYSTGIGVQSGGAVGCPGKGPSFFSALTDARNHFGLNVY